MKIKFYELLGSNLLYTQDLPRILKTGLLTPKNIRRRLPEEIANLDGTIYVDQVYSDPLFEKPIDSFGCLTEICAESATNIIMLSRELKTAGDLKSSFEMRFTLFFDMYMMVNLEIGLKKAFHFWPHWPRMRGSKFFDFYDSSTLFAMLNFCEELRICFGWWLTEVSNMGVVWNMVDEAVNMKFIDWISRVSMFTKFFSGVGALGFPEVVGDDYNLEVELRRVIGNLHYEHEEAAASLAKTDCSKSVDGDDTSINKMRTNGNKVPWNKKDPDFYENKKAIAEAVKVGHEHEIDDLVNLARGYGKIGKLLRKPTCIIRYMSTKSPQCRGRVNKVDWKNYLKNQIKKAQRIASAVEKETLNRIP